MAVPLPLPPEELRQRVGATHVPSAPILERQLRLATWWHEDPEEAWLRLGSHLAELVRLHLPVDVSLQGARVLDFGCGAGRVLRHFVDDVGPEGELHGADIHEESIGWLREHACPPFRAELLDEEPGLPYADGTFDVVYAYSVFTHLVEAWPGWLLELRRVLAPRGVLFATVIGPQSVEELGVERPAPDWGGMTARLLGNPWDNGGPVVVHRREWVEERWGRAFDLEAYAPRATGEPWPHDIIVARARRETVTEEDLLVPGSEAEQEGVAAVVQLQALRRDALAHQLVIDQRREMTRSALAARRGALDNAAVARVAGLTGRHDALLRETREPHAG